MFVKSARKNLLTASLALALLHGPLTPAHAHAEHGQPQFGGIVAEAGHAQFEIVGRDGRVTVHVSNHGMPVETAGASGTLSVLAGSEKRDIALRPAGAARLEGSGQLPPGAKLLISVQWPGKPPLQARAVAP